MEFLAAAIGLILGRIFNQFIHHLPRREPVALRPTCPACGREIAALWLPIGGYLSQGARCPHCRESLPRRIPVVELTTALLFWWGYRTSGLSLETLFAWALAGVAVVVTFIDLEHRLILNKVVLAGIILALPLSLLAGRSLVSTVLGGAAGFGLLMLISGIYPGAMGGGDVKFALVAGLFLGWPNVLVGLVMGFVAGGLVGLALIVLRLRKLKDMIPFGPFLAGGAVAAFWWGQGLVNLYLGSLPGQF